MTTMERAGAAVLALTLIAAAPAEAATDAERIRQLEEMVERQQELLEAMQQELEAIRSRPAPSPVPIEDLGPRAAAPAVVEAPPPPPEADFSMNLYGFAMADVIYDFGRVDPNWEDTLRVSTIPTRGEPFGEDGNFRTGVRQSRFGIRGSYGEDVDFLLEAELYGVGVDAGQTTLRLRHAWATWKRFGVGQHWSNFMDIDIFPNTVDYWGPTGMVFWRNQQFRYTIPLGEDEFAVSLEDPTTSLSIGKFRDFDLCTLPDAPPGCTGGASSAEDLFQAHNELPDVTLRYRDNGAFGHYQIAAIFRDLGFEQLDSGENGQEFGWGVNASTGLRFLQRDMLKLQLAYGEGIGNYMNDAVQDIAPDTADPVTARATSVAVLGVSAYYDHYWNPRWSTSVGWSLLDMDVEAGMGDGEFKRGQIAQLNLLHYPRENVLFGTEFIWGEREDVDGATGEDYRVQFSLKVNFDSGNLGTRLLSDR
jgi:hypothetical protein